MGRVKLTRDTMFEIGIISFAIIMAATLIYLTRNVKRTDNYCESFANTPARDIPARCLRYWK